MLNFILHYRIAHALIKLPALRQLTHRLLQYASSCRKCTKTPLSKDVIKDMIKDVHGGDSSEASRRTDPSPLLDYNLPRIIIAVTTVSTGRGETFQIGSRCTLRGSQGSGVWTGVFSAADKRKRTSTPLVQLKDFVSMLETEVHRRRSVQAPEPEVTVATRETVRRCRPLDLLPLLGLPESTSTPQ